MKVSKSKITPSEKKVVITASRIVIKNKAKVENAAKDFAVRFEDVMRELANG